MNDYNVYQQGNDLQTIQIINRINIAKAFYDRLSITVYMNFKIFNMTDQFSAIMDHIDFNMTLDSATCF